MFFQEQVEEMKKKEERLEKQMAEVMAENKRLVEPLQKARDEVEELRKQLANYEKDKQSLAVSVLSNIQVEITSNPIHEASLFKDEYHSWRYNFQTFTTILIQWEVTGVMASNLQYLWQVLTWDDGVNC